MKRLLLLFCLGIGLFGCEKDSSPTQPPFPLPPPVSLTELLQHVQFAQVDYDSIVYRLDDTLWVEGRPIQRVALGINREGVLVELCNREPVYLQSQGDRRQIYFQIGLRLPADMLIFHSALGIFLTDGSMVEIDSLVQLYRYPYPASEIFLYGDVFEALGGVQDFDLTDSAMYFHPFGPMGQYRYLLDTGRIDTLFEGQPGGDHIALDSAYLFIDFTHDRIARYDVIQNTGQLYWFNLAGLQFNYISGLETVNRRLYCIFGAGEDSFLGWFDYEGNLLGTMPYPRITDNLTAYQNLLISFDFDQRILTFFDLNTGDFVMERPSPAADITGMRVFGDMFYYHDYDRKIVCRVPVEKILGTE